MAGIHGLDKHQHIALERVRRCNLVQMVPKMAQKAHASGAAGIAGDIVMGLAKRAGDEHQKAHAIQALGAAALMAEGCAQMGAGGRDDLRGRDGGRSGGVLWCMRRG